MVREIGISLRISSRRRVESSTLVRISCGDSRQRSSMQIESPEHNYLNRNRLRSKMRFTTELAKTAIWWVRIVPEFRFRRRPNSSSRPSSVLAGPNPATSQNSQTPEIAGYYLFSRLQFRINTLLISESSHHASVSPVYHYSSELMDRWKACFVIPEAPSPTPNPCQLQGG